MLSVVVSIIFFGSMVLQIMLAIKLFNLLRKLSDNDIKISKWSGYAAKRDLKHTLINTHDSEIKEIVTKVLKGMKQRTRLFFGTMGLILLIFILNGIFKWQV